MNRAGENELLLNLMIAERRLYEALSAPPQVAVDLELRATATLAAVGLPAMELPQVRQALRSLRTTGALPAVTA